MISVFEFTNTKLSYNMYNDKFIYKCIFDLTSHIVSKKTHFYLCVHVWLN